MSECVTKLAGPVMAASLFQSGLSAVVKSPGVIQGCPRDPVKRPDAATRRALDDEVICRVSCCCAKHPSPGKAGQNLMQSCADQVFSAADKALGHQSRYKPEISWNMDQEPPTPFMHREDGRDTTQPSEYWQGRAKKEIERYQPGEGWVRRPDITIVDDPTQPPGAGNTERVVELKFGYVGVTC